MKLTLIGMSAFVVLSSLSQSFALSPLDKRSGKPKNNISIPKSLDQDVLHSPRLLKTLPRPGYRPPRLNPSPSRPLRLLSPGYGKIVDLHDHSRVQNQTVFRWARYPGATHYQLTIRAPGDRRPFVQRKSSGTSCAVHLSPRSGAWHWEVRAFSGHRCLNSARSTFSVRRSGGRENGEPRLLSPCPGDRLDNGRRDGRDSLQWHFDWAPMPGATHYQLKVQRKGERRPYLSQTLRCDQFTHVEPGGYLSNRELNGWRWSVTAYCGHRVLGRCESHFCVERVDRDSPRFRSGVIPIPRCR